MKQNYFQVLSHNWHIAFTNKRFRILLLVGAILFAVIITTFNIFFQWVQKREGVVLNDWILDLFTPIDLSVPISLIINILIVIAIIILIKNPVRFLYTLYAYIIMSAFRLTTIYLVPLNPPEGIIPLRDPVLMIVSYQGVMITKDLFFSGHVSTMLLMWLATEGKWLKRIILAGIILVAIGIIIMRVHYSIDIFAAPIFASLAWLLAKQLLLRIEK